MKWKHFKVTSTPQLYSGYLSYRFCTPFRFPLIHVVFPPPTVYVKHVCYTNFTKFNLPTPIYVNLVRDPIERIISWFYYIRAPWYDLKIAFFQIFKLGIILTSTFIIFHYLPCQVLRWKKAGFPRSSAAWLAMASKRLWDMRFKGRPRVHLYSRRNTRRHWRPSQTNTFLLWTWEWMHVSWHLFA